MRLHISWEGQSVAGNHKGEKAVNVMLQGQRKSSCQWLEGSQPGTRHPRGVLGFFDGARASLRLSCAAVWYICSIAQGPEQTWDTTEDSLHWEGSGVGSLYGYSF